MLSILKKLRWQVRILLLLVAAGLAGFALYHVPAINDRLSWRIEIAGAFIRGVISPAGALPAALPPPRVVEVSLTGATPTPPDPAQSSPTPGTPEPTGLPTQTPTPIPASASIPPPRYEKQDINNCGPTTLSMALNFYGWVGDQYTIAAEVKPLKDDRNVNVEELVHYARTHAGWLQTEYRVQGTIPMIKQFIAAGIPVMIEEGFVMAESYWPNDDRWAGHYLYINGYDDSTGSFTTQDVFVSPDHMVSYDDLDKNWQTFNRVMILIFPPEKAPVVQSILGDNWDMDHNRQNAIERNKKETAANPSNAFAWFNLGTNLVYFERYDEAALAYDQARRIGLPQRMLRYQFGPFIAYFNALRTDDLMTLTQYALKITPNSEEDLLWRGWGQYRQKNKDDAIKSFKEALVAHPGYSDALYALQYVQQN